MKKLATLLLALVMLLSLTASAVAEPASADEIAELTKDYAEITFYFQTPVANMSSQDSIEAYLIEYLKDKLNCALRFYPIDAGSYGEKMRTMCAAGESFDLLYTEVAVNPVTAVSQGYFLPITDLLSKYGPDIIASEDPRVWDAATFNGEIMLIPMEVPFAQGSAVVFKADLWDKYADQMDLDYTELNSLEKLEPYLAIIKANEPDITPLQYKLASYNKTAWEVAEGVYYYEEEDKLGLQVDDAWDYDMNVVFADYYQKGYVAKDQIIRQDDQMTEKLTGNYAVLTDSGEFSADGAKSTGMYGYRCYETLYSYAIIKTASMCRGMAISASSEHPERAMLLVNEIWKDPFLSNTIAFGLEGQDYQVISGDVHNLDDSLYIEANSGDAQRWAIWHTWVGPLWDQWNSNWNSTAALEVMQQRNMESPVSGINGFQFNPEPVKVQVASVTAVNEEYEPILNSGSADDVDALYTEWRGRLASAGAAEIMAEVQAQLDSWKAANGK